MATDFDERAATWDDDPAKVERARVVADTIRGAVALGSETSLFEYGAGTAMVSQFLSEHVGAITLAEPSVGMREVIAAKIGDGRLPADSRVWDLDLAAASAPSGERFDLVVTVMTLHHIHDVASVLTAFAALLAEGGRLCVADLEEEDGSFHSDDHDFEGHHGFERGALATQLEAAGFTDVRFQPCHVVEKESGTFPLFLATAART
ncbi:MAG: class I SAM-dependent methyltransferase [Actinobacteria bacterium]|nr:class I SAM-dependent methyltransferase [Actinomycetota bacterium]